MFRLSGCSARAVLRVRRVPCCSKTDRKVGHCASRFVVRSWVVAVAVRARRSAPDQADTYLVANGGDKTKNFGRNRAQDRCGRGSTDPVRSLDAAGRHHRRRMWRRRAVLLWVNKVDTAGSITVQPATSAWSELVVTYNTAAWSGQRRCRWSRSPR